MRLLVVKTSSLGDVIHTLPALTDVHRFQPTISCDWVVEEAFAEIPRWHPAVNQVIPIALRRWRKRPWQARTEWQIFKQKLTHHYYDWIIDAQGLLKSAFLTYQAKGQRHGLDWSSAREPFASFIYQHRYRIPKNQHAVSRVRQLFAQVLGYENPQNLPDYGIAKSFQIQPESSIIFLHSTTWETKHWPEAYWLELAQSVISAGYTIKLPWFTQPEHARAQRLAALHPKKIILIPKTNLQGMAVELAQAKAVVGVDTGLAHLAAALAIPTVTLYGATEPAWTGTFGQRQHHLQVDFPCAPCLRKICPYAINPPCYQSLTAERVWQTVQTLLEKGYQPPLTPP